MNLQTRRQTPVHRPVGTMVPAARLTGFEGVVLRHLATPSEIESVLHLREEIDLSVHASANSDFALLEKKETNWGLWALSS